MKNKKSIHPVRIDETKKQNPKTSNTAVYQKNGVVLEALPSIHFRVMLDDGKEIIAHLAGKLRIHRIKVLPGDKVTVEMSPYDEKRGRIVYRRK